MRRIQKIAAFLLIIAMSMGAVPLGFTHKTAQAAATEKAPSSSGWDVFVDSNGDVNIVTNDKKKTSSIYYRTVGFTIARGKFNPSMKKLANGAATDFFYVPLGNMTVDTSTEGGREINSFKMSYAEMKSRIGGVSGEWLQEIEDAEKYGGTAYIRFDCEMIIFHGTSTDGYRYMNDPTRGPYDDENADLNPREIQSAEPWSAGANTGLRSHFHRWLPITSS